MQTATNVKSENDKDDNVEVTLMNMEKNIEAACNVCGKKVHRKLHCPQNLLR